MRPRNTYGHVEEKLLSGTMEFGNRNRERDTKERRQVGEGRSIKTPTALASWKTDS